MISALMLAAMWRQDSIRTVELSRGVTVPAYQSARTFQYWDTTDTFIDGSSPEDNFGAEPVVSAGPNKLVLIRFGDLNRVLGPTRRVLHASLILTIAGGDNPALKGVSRILANWNAGPYFSVGALLKRNAEQASGDAPKGKEKSSAPRYSATWRNRLVGEAGAYWQEPGATGAEDAEPIKDAQATVTEKEVTIDGLAGVVQQMADHPTRNFGFGLQFQTNCEFFSSRAALGHPRLRLELGAAPAASGPDLSVTEIQESTTGGGAPTPGEPLTYTAHIKNVGSGAAPGFGTQWILDGKPAQTSDVNDSLTPGAETTVTLRSPFRPDAGDARVHTIEMRVTPHGKDANPTNNDLLIYENGRQIDVQVSADVAKKAAVNLLGSSSIEDWVQAQVRVFNETYAAQSRFSFAPDGALERVSVRNITIGGSQPQEGAHPDGVAAVPADEDEWYGADPAFLRAIGLAAGLPDFRAMSFPAGKGIQLKADGKQVDRGTTDLYPGVIGYGDTRNEAGLGPVWIPYEPYPSPNSGILPMTPTGLLSATDVAVLNSLADGSSKLFEMPKTTFIKATDLGGHPLRATKLDFFQSQNGQIPDAPPVLSVTTSDQEGTALLPNKGGFGPFGKLTSDGENGTFLIKASANGETEWGWLKAWQLIDTASRGNTSAGVVEVRFDLPSAVLDRSVDLAKDRIISDSTNLLPAKLGALVSGTVQQEVTLGGKTGDWVEIDLGRDRTIGEISLLGSAAGFWPQFDILVYGTGQTVADAAPWASELNWNWTASNRRDLIPNDPSTVSVAYRSLAVRIRFIRIVNRSASVGKLKGIRVTPVKIGT